VSRIEETGRNSLRRPKLSTRKFSAWKKKKTATSVSEENVLVFFRIYLLT